MRIAFRERLHSIYPVHTDKDCSDITRLGLIRHEDDLQIIFPSQYCQCVTQILGDSQRRRRALLAWVIGDDKTSSSLSSSATEMTTNLLSVTKDRLPSIRKRDHPQTEEDPYRHERLEDRPLFRSSSTGRFCMMDKSTVLIVLLHEKGRMSWSTSSSSDHLRSFNDSWIVCTEFLKVTDSIPSSCTSIVWLSFWDFDASTSETSSLSRPVNLIWS